LNEYIIYTTEGYTTAPNENLEVENCQVLGHARGKIPDIVKAADTQLSCSICMDDSLTGPLPFLE